MRTVRVVPGNRILEVGAGLGLLALGLAQEKEHVKAIELMPERHSKALELKETWRTLGKHVDNCEFYLGDIFENEHLFHGVDTLVARRVIYYFGDQIATFFQRASREVKYVCLIGNPNRQRRYNAGIRDKSIGEAAYYSTVAGMCAILKEHGFAVTYVNDEHEPTVIGERRGS